MADLSNSEVTNFEYPKSIFDLIHNTDGDFSFDKFAAGLLVDNSEDKEVDPAYLEYVKQQEELNKPKKIDTKTIEDAGNDSAWTPASVAQREKELEAGTAEGISSGRQLAKSYSAKVKDKATDKLYNVYHLGANEMGDMSYFLEDVRAGEKFTVPVDGFTDNYAFVVDNKETSEDETNTKKPKREVNKSTHEMGGTTPGRTQGNPDFNFVSDNTLSLAKKYKEIQQKFTPAQLKVIKEPITQEDNKTVEEFNSLFSNGDITKTDIAGFLQAYRLSPDFTEKLPVNIEEALSKQYNVTSKPTEISPQPVDTKTKSTPEETDTKPKEKPSSVNALFENVYSRLLPAVNKARETQSVSTSRILGTLKRTDLTPEEINDFVKYITDTGRYEALFGSVPEVKSSPTSASSTPFTNSTPPTVKPTEQKGYTVNTTPGVTTTSVNQQEPVKEKAEPAKALDAMANDAKLNAKPPEIKKQNEEKPSAVENQPDVEQSTIDEEKLDKWYNALAKKVKATRNSEEQKGKLIPNSTLEQYIKNSVSPKYYDAIMNYINKKGRDVIFDHKLSQDTIVFEKYANLLIAKLAELRKKLKIYPASIDDTIVKKFGDKADAFKNYLKLSGKYSQVYL